MWSTQHNHPKTHLLISLKGRRRRKKKKEKNLDRLTDWRVTHSLPPSLPPQVLVSGLLFLQRGRVVVTERLHGHILATLLDIPHVVLDNRDRKLSSYHRTWTRGLRNVRLASSAPEAARLALELLEEYGPSLPPVFRGMDIREHEGRGEGRWGARGTAREHEGRAGG